MVCRMGFVPVRNSIMPDLPELKTVSIDDLTPDEFNINAATQRGRAMIKRSISELGAGRSILVDKKGNIIAGNTTTKNARELGFENVVVVPTDGKTLIAVQRTDLDLDDDPEGTARQLALADNRTSEISYNPDKLLLDTMLQTQSIDTSWMWDEGETTAIHDETQLLLEQIQDEERETDAIKNDPDRSLEEPFDNDLQDEYEPELSHSERVHTIWRCPEPGWALDRYDIPMLLDTQQGTIEDIKAGTHVWGQRARTQEHPGTVFHYVSDYRFSGQWSKPDALPATLCSSFGEVNFSTADGQPEAMVLWDTYRKRWLSRYWQAWGMRVFVDCYITKRWEEQTFYGVPKTWRSFCARYVEKTPAGNEVGPEGVMSQFLLARDHTGVKYMSDLLCVVVGGTDKAQEFCKEQGFVHIPEHSALVRGKLDVWLPV